MRDRTQLGGWRGGGAISWVHRERERDESNGGGEGRGSVGGDDTLVVELKSMVRWGDVAESMLSRVGRSEKSSKGCKKWI